VVEGPITGVLLFALSGGLAGLFAGEASWRLVSSGPLRVRPDWLSWLLAAGGAAVMVGIQVARDHLPGLAVEAGLVGLLLWVTATDVRERAVYPAVVYPGIALMVLGAPQLGNSIAEAALGAALAVGLFAILYVVGRIRYGPDALGSGDIGVAGLLGAAVGAPQLGMAFGLAAVLAAGFGLIAGWRARSLRVTFPYAPALCVAGLLMRIMAAAP
jgi:prepilin signal peptidase PulO-like enzyme (type II secretory pathway)